MFPRIYQPIRSREAADARIRWGETVEDSHLDFKHAANLEKPEELAMDVAALANTFGGTLLIGVSEKTNERNLKVAQGRVSVENAEALRRFFNQEIRSFVHPGVSLRTDFIHYDDATILCAVNVEPSVDLVWVIVNRDTSAAAFPYRNEYGKNYWRPHEAEMRWNNTERRVYLKLVSLVQGKGLQYLNLYPAPLRPNPDLRGGYAWKGTPEFVPAPNPTISISPADLRESEFSFVWGTYKMELPYSFVKDVWRKTPSYLGMVLSAQVYDNGQRMDLHPLEK